MVWHLALGSSRGNKPPHHSLLTRSGCPLKTKVKNGVLHSTASPNDSLLGAADGTGDLNYSSVKSRTEKNAASLSYLQMPHTKRRVWNFSIVISKWGYIMNVFLVFKLLFFCIFALAISDGRLNRRPLLLNHSLPEFYSWLEVTLHGEVIDFS